MTRLLPLILLLTACSNHDHIINFCDVPNDSGQGTHHEICQMPEKN